MRNVLVWFLAASSLLAQEAAKPKSTVLYVSEPQSVPAGKPAIVEVHFKVIEGYHINSHTPKSDLLLPTALKTEPATNVTAGAPVYSPGQPFSFAFSPDEKLDVYIGDFTVKLPLTAAAGPHTLDATLHFQACDHAACYPPKALPVQIPFTAK